jgi:hypothetical protein
MFYTKKPSVVEAGEGVNNNIYYSVLQTANDEEDGC